MMTNEGSTETTLGRTCFVIMPFSATETFTEDKWTLVFEELIKPSVEDADYDCRRSAATRGNLIKEIIQDLDTSWVVLADLTDQNPNVFYELGVRHALKNRTILVAQNRSDIPFDLRSYANHVYDPETEEGRQEFADRIKTLLQDVDRDPHRADNPVSDFLKSPIRQESSPRPAFQQNDIEGRVDALEKAIQALVGDRTVSPPSASVLSKIGELSPFGEGESGVNWYDVGVEIATAKNSRVLRSVVRRTVRDGQNAIPNRVDQLNSTPTASTLKRNEIEEEALKFENEFAPITGDTELMALGLASEGWETGAQGILEIAGSLISIGEGSSGLRLASGLPAFFAWRLLLIAGACSIQEVTFGVTTVLINGPIPVVRLGGQITHQSLLQHRDLFFPEALLGYADLGIRQVGSLYQRCEHIHAIFGSEDQFATALAEFLVLVALCDTLAPTEDRPLYPGYRLLPGFENACRRLISRLVMYPDQLNEVAGVLGLTGEELRGRWPNLADTANSANLGSDYFLRGRGGLIPNSLD